MLAPGVAGLFRIGREFGAGGRFGNGNLGYAASMADAWKSAAEEMDRCKWLWLDDIEVTRGYGLRIRVEESVPRRQYEDLDRDFTPDLATRIRAENPDCEVQRKGRAFEITFREVISYTVVNESYGKYPETPEAFTGKLFRVFSWSYLMEFIRKTTYASDDHPGPGPLQHYEIVCQDDVVDVIACVEPVIVALRTEYGDPSPSAQDDALGR